MKAGWCKLASWFLYSQAYDKYVPQSLVYGGGGGILRQAFKYPGVLKFESLGDNIVAPKYNLGPPAHIN